MDLAYQNKCMPFLFSSIAFLILSVNWKMALFFYSLTSNEKSDVKQTKLMFQCVCVWLFFRAVTIRCPLLWIRSHNVRDVRCKKVTFHFSFTYEKSQLQQRLIGPNFSRSKIIKKCIRIRAENQCTGTKQWDKPNAYSSSRTQCTMRHAISNAIDDVFAK